MADLRAQNALQEMLFEVGKALGPIFAADLLEKIVDYGEYRVMKDRADRRSAGHPEGEPEGESAS